MRERLRHVSTPTGINTTRRCAAIYIIRETFTAKPGMASKLAKMFREMFEE
jgi:hypothetical protein